MDAQRVLERVWTINESNRHLNVLYEQAGDEHAGHSS